MKSATAGQEEGFFVCDRDKRLLRVSLSQPNTVYQQNIYPTSTQLLIETWISTIVTNTYFTFCPARIVIWPTVRTYPSLVKLQPGFLSLRWKTCLWAELQPWFLSLQWRTCSWAQYSWWWWWWWYIFIGGEGWLGFPDLWSGQKPWWNWYLIPVVNFCEFRRAHLAKFTLLTPDCCPWDLFRSSKVCLDAKKSGVRKATGSYRTYSNPGKSANLFPEFAVEDLPFSRTATLVLRLQW